MTQPRGHQPRPAYSRSGCGYFAAGVIDAWRPAPLADAMRELCLPAMGYWAMLCELAGSPFLGPRLVNRHASAQNVQSAPRSRSRSQTAPRAAVIWSRPRLRLA